MFVLPIALNKRCTLSYCLCYACYPWPWLGPLQIRYVLPVLGKSLYLLVGNERVPKMVINDILLISKHNSFRVLFDKIASVYFI